MAHCIAEHEVHVWHLLVDDAMPSDSVRPLLSADEARRAAGFRRERDRRLFELSRGLMRRVLASYLDCDGRELDFSVNPFGKPILAGAPAPDADLPTSAGPALGAGLPTPPGPGRETWTRRQPLHFNLTHSHGAIALAVSRNREVGIDIEDRHRQVEYLALAERFFAGAEADHLRTLSDHARREAFFAIWTLKEAFVKAIGRGLTFPLDAFAFELDRDRLVGFRPLADGVTPDWHFHQFDLGDRHRGAVAAQNPAGEALKMILLPVELPG